MLSKDNKLVKNALKLKQRKYRESEGKFLIEGIRFVEEALKSGMVEYILYSEKVGKLAGHKRVMDADCEMYEVEQQVLNELSDTENPQGVIAVVKKNEWKFEEIKNGLVVIADGIQDPGNLGTIIRTSDAAGVGGILIVKGTVDVYNDKVLRSTMGSIFHLPVLFFDDFDVLSEKLKQNGYNIYATSLSGSEYIYGCDFRGKTAFVIGNEANGVPEEHVSLSTHKIKIPMPGNAESLNAASAAAVIIYEAVRQRIEF